MSRVAVRPLNREANRAANNEFYENHPEMIQDAGTRIPIDPNSREHSAYRREWMDSYVAHGGEVIERGRDDADDEEEEAVEEEPEAEPDDAVEPCPELVPIPVEDPEPLLVNVEWDEPMHKCGDIATMVADTLSIDAGEDATFTVKKISDGSTVETCNAQTSGGFVLTCITLKKLSDDWDDGPELMFTVEACGVSVDSDELWFHRYEDIASTNFNQAMNSVNVAPGSNPPQHYGWQQRVKVQLDDRVLKIHVPIKVRKRSTTRPARGAAETLADWLTRCRAVALEGDGKLTAAEKTTYKNNIEGMYRRKKSLHRRRCGAGCTDRCARKCCRLEIKVLLHFYDHDSATAATMVELWKGDGRSSSGNWFVNDSTAVSAHEVGHLMGFYDEYNGGAEGPAPWQHPNAGKLMCDLGAGLENYYFNHYATWLGSAARTSEPWDVEPYS